MNAMSALTDTAASGLEWPLEEESTAARVRELVGSHGLPAPRRAGRGYGTAVLRAAGPFPLDDLLAWAGEMSREPHWWTLRGRDGTTDVHAAGYVHGLAVSIAASTREPIGARIDTAAVLAAAAAERASATPTRRDTVCRPGCLCPSCRAEKCGAGPPPPLPR